jgi:hypothetical protein
VSHYFQYKKVVLELNVSDSRVQVVEREQYEEHRHDFNSIGEYEMCHDVELTPPESEDHCSIGTRWSIDGRNSSCLLRIDQHTYDVARTACQKRGGRLLNVDDPWQLVMLEEFVGTQEVGIGIRDYGGYNRWRFDGPGDKSAADMISKLEKNCGTCFEKLGCIKTQRRGTMVATMDCEAKSDWVCEGLETNTLTAGLTVQNDLKADEGAFCLWHYEEPVDALPNDEGTNFRNTDLTCNLSVSSRIRTHCEYTPQDPGASRRRDNGDLTAKRGSRFNEANYPVKGWQVGWKGSAANADFLKLEDARDHYHCHFTPSNTGMIRLMAMQHMYERNYPGSMKRSCGCGYKHIQNLVSRCDCTRDGKQNNNCPKWQRESLRRATQGNPVRCNNCNSNSPI